MPPPLLNTHGSWRRLTLGNAPRLFVPCASLTTEEASRSCVQVLVQTSRCVEAVVAADSASPSPPRVWRLVPWLDDDSADSHGGDDGVNSDDVDCPLSTRARVVKVVVRLFQVSKPAALERARTHGHGACVREPAQNGRHRALSSISVTLVWPQGATQAMKHVAHWGGVTVFDAATHDALPRLATLVYDRDSSRAFALETVRDTFTACIVSPTPVGRAGAPRPLRIASP